jgi:hypothetical protein
LIAGVDLEKEQVSRRINVMQQIDKDEENSLHEKMKSSKRTRNNIYIEWHMPLHAPLTPRQHDAHLLQLLLRVFVLFKTQGARRMAGRVAVAVTALIMRSGKQEGEGGVVCNHSALSPRILLAIAQIALITFPFEISRGGGPFHQMHESAFAHVIAIPWISRLVA